MEIPTLKVQMKIAELLHDIGCADKPTTHEEDERDKCLDWPTYVKDSAFFLGKLMPSIITEMFPAVRADERDKVRYHIEAELVCCDLYEQIVATDLMARPRDVAAMLGLTYHPICYYGGWAAALAAGGPECDHRGVEFPTGCGRC